MAELASPPLHPPPQPAEPEISGSPPQDFEDSAASLLTGQQNDAAKALLGLNNVVDLPYETMETPAHQIVHLVAPSDASLPQNMQHQDSGGTFAADDNNMIPGLPEMLVTPPMMHRQDASMEAGAFSAGSSSNSNINIQNRQAADAQYQMASALHMIQSGAPYDSGKGPKKRRKKGAKGNENEQDSSAGSSRGMGGLPFDSQIEGQVFQGWPLPPTLPQFQSPNGASPFSSPNMPAGSTSFFVGPKMGQTFGSGEAGMPLVNANGGVFPGNGVFTSSPFSSNGPAAAQGMLQSVMSQFAMGVGGGIFAGVPNLGAPGNGQMHGANGAGKPPRRAGTAAEKDDAGSKKRNEDDKGEGKGRGKQRYYKSLSCNYWNSLDDHDNEEAGSDEGNMDITTPWRCEVCNIYFTSAQALGGHRINSTDHKQRCEKLRRGDTASLPGTPRLSLHVYSNEETAEKGKRTRLPPMAQMAGFDRVLLGFPSDVRMALARIQSPAAYFSSCSLDVFRRHEKFGTLGDLIINKYFTSSSDTFEGMMQNPKAIAEVEQAGFSSDMADDVHNELKIFARMLLTKKKFLDINRRAVSKRIKGIRKAGGERLKEFNQKKARHASLGPVGNSQTEHVSAPPPDVLGMTQPVQTAAISVTGAPTPAVGQMAPPMEPYPRAVF